MATWPALIGELGGAGARSARSWLAASGGRARGDGRGRGAMKVRGRFEPEQALPVAAAALRCARDAPPHDPPHSLTQLTASSFACLAAPVQPGRHSTTTRDVSKTSELLYHQGRVGLGASEPTWRCSEACAMTLAALHGDHSAQLSRRHSSDAWELRLRTLCVLLPEA